MKSRAVLVFVAVLSLGGTVLGSPVIHEPGKSVEVLATDPLLQSVSGLAPRPGGGLYASTEMGLIVAISPAGDVQQVADLSASMMTLSNIAVDADGMILVGDASGVSPTNNIWEVSPGTGAATLVYGYAYSPTDIHLDSAGDMLVVERLGIQGVSRIARDGSWRDVLLDAADQGWQDVPTGIDLDSEGNLLVGYRDDGAIYRLSAGGNPELFAHVPAGNSVLALCFSPEGELFAANDLTGEIYRIDAEGDVDLFASGIDRPRYMTFDGTGRMCFAAFNEATVYVVVPEPATLSLLALGGIAVMRRRNQEKRQ